MPSLPAAVGFVSGVVLLSAVAAQAAGVGIGDAWTAVEPMSTPRAFAASAVSRDRWYVAGGRGRVGEVPGFPTSIEMYDPTAERWSVVGALAMGGEYIMAIANSLPGGVLFAGGLSPGGVTGYLPLDGAMLGDGVTWTSTALQTGRYSHAMAFAAGRFVVTGGWGSPMMDDTLLDDAEVYEASTTTAWASAGRMPSGPKAGHTMTTLADGRRIAAVGGCRPDAALTTTDLLDASTLQWSRAAELTARRCRHAAIRLLDGRIFVTGSISGRSVLASSELYDPSTDRWTPAGAMHTARFDHAMALLPDGRVIAVGGSNDAENGERGALGSVEIYDPATDSWREGPPLGDVRRWPNLAVLGDAVYVTGGGNATGQLASTERLRLTVEPVEAPMDGGGNSDAAGASDVGDADRAPAPRSGCSCEIGADGPGPLLPILLVVLALLSRAGRPISFAADGPTRRAERGSRRR